MITKKNIAMASIPGMLNESPYVRKDGYRLKVKKENVREQSRIADYLFRIVQTLWFSRFPT